MGWHYILEVECDILQEYADFIEKEYLCEYGPQDIDYGQKQRRPDETVELSKRYRDLIDNWIKLRIGHHWYEYSFSNGTFACQIQKKVSKHAGDLWDDLLSFVKDILVPISSKINVCRISEDDFGYTSINYTYSELRGRYLNLSELIKHINHVVENNEIVETHIIYKRSIPQSQEEYLTRCYQK
jgi:hypothetical protein